MELFLFKRDEYNRLYNCSGVEHWINDVPIERRRQFDVQAWITIVISVVCYVLYLPVMCSIWKHMKGSSSIQLLFYIGIMDMAILWILGLLHPWLSLQGAIFCSYPTLIYISGVLCSSIWRAESCADWLLAINRCLDIAYPELAKKLFAGHRTPIWLTLSTFYFFWWIWVPKPCLFTAIHFSWFFNPYVGYRDDPDGVYIVPMHAYHDMFMAISFPIIYGIFIVLMHLRTTAEAQSLRNALTISKAEKMTFLQVALLSLLNSCSCTIYIYMQFKNPPTQFIITSAEFGWLFIHALPPVIFLALNKTIRKDCRQMLSFKIF